MYLLSIVTQFAKLYAQQFFLWQNRFSALRSNSVVKSKVQFKWETKYTGKIGTGAHGVSD